MVRRQILLKTNIWLGTSQVGRTDRFQVVTMRVWASTLCTLCGLPALIAGILRDM